MSEITVIIPVYNLVQRGWQRVVSSIQSLEMQSYKPSIVVVDGSGDVQYKILAKAIEVFHVKHIHFPMDEFNLPALYNAAIRQSLTKWILCTGADFLFSKDMMEICLKYADDKRILFKEVGMLPNVNITRARVAAWNMKGWTYNRFGKLANGAIQFTSRKWFMNNPHDERLSGWGAMDNMLAYQALKSSLEIFWIPRGEGDVLHQWHPAEKFRTKELKEKFEINQRILKEFKEKHKLPEVLA